MTVFGGRLYFLPHRDKSRRELGKSKFLHRLVTQEGAKLLKVKGKSTGIGADSLPQPKTCGRILDDFRFVARAMFPCLQERFEFSSVDEFLKVDWKLMCEALASDFSEVAKRSHATMCMGGRSRSAAVCTHQSSVLQGTQIYRFCSFAFTALIRCLRSALRSGANQAADRRTRLEEGLREPCNARCRHPCRSCLFSLCA